MAERFITYGTLKRVGDASLAIQPRVLTAALTTAAGVNLSYGVDGVAWVGTVTLQSSANELFTSPTAVTTYTAGGSYNIASPNATLFYRLVLTALTSGQIDYDLFNADNSDVLAMAPGNPLNAALIRRAQGYT